MRRVRAFENEKIQAADPLKRPAFHLTGAAGWINDPNGFSVYKGEVHLFYQANPYENTTGPIYWGHVKTRDFLHWDRLPCALAPDSEYDKDGCFSGGAVETEDGRHMLMYTGFKIVSEEDKKYVQTQCVAVGDGTDYIKYDGNPVLSGPDLPAGSSIEDFRDPKIWRENDSYFAATVNRDSETKAAILIFTSPDGFNWKYKGTALRSDLPHGRMWECPDIFSLDSLDCVMMSLQGRDGDVPESEKEFVTILKTGAYDREKCRFEESREFIVDFGTDFYAPQTVLLSDGRRVMIAWMASWRTAFDAPKSLDFCGQMSFPREIRLENGVLTQLPVREILDVRGECRALDHSGAGRFSDSGIHGRVCDIEGTLKLLSDSGNERFRINLAEDGSHKTVIEIDASSRTVSVDMRDSGNPRSMRSLNSFKIDAEEDPIKFRILLDRFSLEIFMNDGKQAAAYALYTPQEAGGISFDSSEGISSEIRYYGLNFNRLS